MFFIVHLIIITVILITFGIGLINFKKYRKTKVRYFLYFLVYMFVSESFAYTMKVRGYIMNPLYNISFIIYFTFYFFLFGSLLKDQGKKKTIKKFTILFVVLSLLNMCFIQTNFFALQTHTFFLGSVLLIITIILFYIEIFNNDVIFRIKNVLLFWISIGLLLFHVGVFPVLIAGNFLNFRGIFNSILLVLNVLMYSCYIIGFLWTKEKYNY